jgi:DNA-binding NtrC family response regulator
MNQKLRMINGGQGLEAMAIASELDGTYTRVPGSPPAPDADWADPGTGQTMEKIQASLVFAYLSSNLNMKFIPLKAFMDDFEKKVLLSCLRLTPGTQKNAAALLTLKPTALFEKMRNHGIRSQRGRLPGSPAVALAPDGNN